MGEFEKIKSNHSVDSSDLNSNHPTENIIISKKRESLKSEKKHSIKLKSGDMTFHSRTDTIRVESGDDKNLADFFYTEYFIDDSDANHSCKNNEYLHTRPVTFIYNGGPGSSSVWLHIGAFGPFKVDLSSDVPPYEIGVNENTILDHTDLVFIDPVTTGFSRSAVDDKADLFHGVKGDIESIASFIYHFISRTKRWNCPKYLIGESYGTLRSAGLVNHIQKRYGLYFNGIVFISSVLDFQTILFENSNIMPYPFFLPSYAATAWHYGLIDKNLYPDVQSIMVAAEAFIDNYYIKHLFKGFMKGSDESKEIAETLSKITGLKKEFILRCKNRISQQDFCKNLLEEKGLIAGRLDSTWTGIDDDMSKEYCGYDPSYSKIYGPFTGAVMHLFANILGCDSHDCNRDDNPVYEILTSKVRPWDEKEYQNKYVDMTGELKKALCENSGLRLLFMNGIYDLATPHSAVKYTINHLADRPELRKRINYKEYESGHMIYIDDKSHSSMKKDLIEFFEK